MCIQGQVLWNWLNLSDETFKILFRFEKIRFILRLIRNSRCHLLNFCSLFTFHSLSSEATRTGFQNELSTNEQCILSLFNLNKPTRRSKHSAFNLCNLTGSISMIDVFNDYENVCARLNRIWLGKLFNPLGSFKDFKLLSVFNCTIKFNHYEQIHLGYHKLTDFIYLIFLHNLTNCIINSSWFKHGNHKLFQ